MWRSGGNRELKFSGGAVSGIPCKQSVLAQEAEPRRTSFAAPGYVPSLAAMRMTLEQIRVFVEVAEREHVTRAAEALHVAQSAVSAAIAALESAYGVRLFNRVGRRIELTNAGRQFLVEARAVVAGAEAADRALDELGSLRRGSLVVQASQTIASYWLPRHLAAFRRAYPGIEIRLSIGNTAQVAAAVLDGSAELGFVEGAVESATLVSREIAKDQMVLVVGPDHPWARQGVSMLGDAVTQGDWVLRENGSGTRSVFEAALRDAGIPLSALRVVLELPSNEAVRSAVEAGLGATVISASVAAPSIEAGLLHHVKLALPIRPFQALWHEQRLLSGQSSALLSMIAAPSIA